MQEREKVTHDSFTFTRSEYSESSAKEDIHSLDQVASVFNNGREKRIVLFSVARMAVACVPQRGLAFQKGFYKGEEM